MSDEEDDQSLPDSVIPGLPQSDRQLMDRQLMDVGIAGSPRKVRVSTTLASSLPRASSASVLSPEFGVSNLKCDLCELSYPLALMVNVGNAQFPRWRDKPCHNSARFYDKILASHDVVPGDMKKNDPVRYKKNVMRFRVVAEDDPPEVKEACKCQTAKDRSI